jgi:flagellar motor component MotA
MVHGKQSVEVLTPSFAKSNPKQGIIIAGTARRAYVMVGWTGVLIGSIQMGSSLDDLSNFGPAFAALMLCPFYGHLMEFSIWMPLKRVMMVQAQSLEI